MNTEQRNVLLDILVQRVSPAELQTMVFKILGAGAYNNLPGSAHTERCIAFMEELHRREQEDKLLVQLSKSRPDIDISEPIKTETPSREGDEYSVYQDGTRELISRLGDTHPRYADALVYQQRLDENIARSRRYGDTETHRAERAEILVRLNTLTLSVIGISFDELCNADT
jgi:hypothetical protein